MSVVVLCGREADYSSTVVRPNKSSLILSNNRLPDFAYRTLMDSMEPKSPEFSVDLDGGEVKSEGEDMGMDMDGGDLDRGMDGERPLESFEGSLCKVCGDQATGMYFGALVCVPCKTFFLRYAGDGFSFQCKYNGSCEISIANRTQCKYCRYQKCVSAGMKRRVRPATIQHNEGQQMCMICEDVANGIHFGVITCEGCKKFFRRGLVEHQSYVCKNSEMCIINPRTRNSCRLCRYKKCLAAGMSREAIQMGRPSKLKYDRDIARPPSSSVGRPFDIKQEEFSNMEYNNGQYNYLSNSYNDLRRNSFTAINSRASLPNYNNLNPSSSNLNLSANGEGRFSRQFSLQCKSNSDDKRFMFNDKGDESRLYFKTENLDPGFDEYEDGLIKNDAHRGNFSHDRMHRLTLSNKHGGSGGTVSVVGNGERDASPNFKTSPGRAITSPDSCTLPFYITKVAKFRDLDSNANEGSKNKVLQADGLRKYSVVEIFDRLGFDGIRPRTNTMPTCMPSDSGPSNTISESVQNFQTVEGIQASSDLSKNLFTFSGSNGDGDVRDGGGKMPSFLRNKMRKHRDMITVPGHVSPTSPTSRCSSVGNWMCRDTNSPYDSLRGLSWHLIQSQNGAHFLDDEGLGGSLGSEEARRNRRRNSDVSSLHDGGNCCIVLSDEVLDKQQKLCEIYWSSGGGINGVGGESLGEGGEVMFEEKHREFISQTLNCYNRFVQTSTKINRKLTDELRNLVKSKSDEHQGKTMNDHWTADWIQQQVVPIYTLTSITYCKSLTGFKKFDMEDQQTLIRLGQSPSRILVAAVHWYNPQTNDFDDFLSWRTDLFKKRLLDCAAKIYRLDLDTVEAAMLNALIIIASDYPGLHNPHLIEEARKEIISSFKAYVTAKLGSQNNRLETLFREMVEVKKLGFLHYRMTKTQSIRAEECSEN